MTERDAFGNEIGPTDPTVASGAPAPVSASAPATPLAPATPGAASRPSAAPAWAGRRNRPGAVGRIVRGLVSVALFFAVLGGVGVALLASTVSGGVDAVRSFTSELSTAAPVPALPGGPEAEPAPPPTGVGRGSLLRRASFSAAITKLRGAGLGRLRSLRVAADRIDAQLVTRTGRLRSVQIVPGGTLRTLSTSPPGFPTATTLSFAAIDRGVPQRLARSAAGRARRPTSAVDYLVLLDAGGRTGWAVYLKGGRAFLADARGRIERRIS